MRGRAACGERRRWAEQRRRAWMHASMRGSVRSKAWPSKGVCQAGWDRCMHFGGLAAGCSGGGRTDGQERGNPAKEASRASGLPKRCLPAPRRPNRCGHCCWVLISAPLLARAPALFIASEGRTTNTRPALTNTALQTTTAHSRKPATRTEPRRPPSDAAAPPAAPRSPQPRPPSSPGRGAPARLLLLLRSCSCAPTPARPTTPACLPDPRRQADRPNSSEPSSPGTQCRRSPSSPLVLIALSPRRSASRSGLAQPRLLVRHAYTTPSYTRRAPVDAVQTAAADGAVAIADQRRLLEPGIRLQAPHRTAAG